MTQMVSPCKNCRNLQNRSEDFEESETASSQCLNTTVKSLQRSATEGCSTCRLISRAIEAYNHRFAGVETDDIQVLGSFMSKNIHQLPVAITLRWKVTDPAPSKLGNDERSHYYTDLKIELYRDADHHPTVPAVGCRDQISIDPFLDSGLSTLVAMIEQCSLNHKSCLSTRSAVLPRRMLDVWDGIRLRDFTIDNIERRSDFGNYMTLSHCYGSGRNVLRTTKETLKTFEKSISMSELPKTFQDAVYLTRELGVRWLWIDSLCILQDSDAEKLEESDKMDEIFGNSYLTVAATSAGESTDGLFSPKETPIKLESGSEEGTYVREQPTHYNFEAPVEQKAHSNEGRHPFSIPDAPSPETPLLRRAWPYVERLLSRRVIHFTKSEMIFECREGYQCECGRLGNPMFDSVATDTVKQKFAEVLVSQDNPFDNAGANSNESALKSLIPRLDATSLDSVPQRDQALNLWSHIVSAFTSKDLTYEKDRLVAIASIAKSFSKTLRSGYVAGQWTFSVYNLLWYPQDGSTCHRPSYKVPSWSWASVEGSPIFFDNETAMDLSCTAEYESGGEENSTWSPTSGGTLELTVALATEVTFTVQDTTRRSALTKNGVSVSFTPDISPPGANSEIAPGETLVCVLVIMTFRSTILGLILKRNEETGVYRRVGRLECSTCEGNAEDSDAEALFGYWVPDVSDITTIDDTPHKTFVIE